MALVSSGSKNNNTNRMTISNMVILGGRAGYSQPTAWCACDLTGIFKKPEFVKLSCKNGV